MAVARRRRLRVPATGGGWGVAMLAAILVAEAAVLLMRPRSGVIDPAPVEPGSYFSAAEIDRATAFRGPQLWLYLASVLVQAGVLALLVRAARRGRFPGRLMPGSLARRPLAGAAAAGASVAVLLTMATLPLVAISRQRAIDVGLVTRSWPGWARDVALSAAIEAALAAAGFALAVALIRRFPRGWWAPASVVVVTLAVVFACARPVVLDPLFNSFTPLPAGRTRADVLDLARRAGMKVAQVYVVDASRRTTAANAYVTGLGATKRVVLYDNLIRGFSRDELRLVVAHELGHVHYRDVPRGLLYVALVTPLGLLAAARLTETLRPHAGSLGGGAPLVPALALSLALVSTAVLVVSNQLSRRVEARADSFALRLTDAPEPFIAFERRIAVRNVSDPDPPAWETFLLATHPPVTDRIGAGVAYREERRGTTRAEAGVPAVTAPRARRTPGGS